MLSCDLTENKKLNMPDIAKSTKGDYEIPLERVGMTEVEIPVYLDLNGEKQLIPAKADLFVNLVDTKAKGIHMSRLFLNAQDTFEKEALNLKTLKKLLNKFVDSHTGLSDCAEINIVFELMTLRNALLSDYKGWRSYPVQLKAKLEENKFHFELNLSVLYSSTCPCSAALSRQLIQEHFENHFKDKSPSVDEVSTWLSKAENIVATPHSQRSEASVKIKINPDLVEVPFIEMIDLIESSLATPVQSAVKREDEQEFARLNASNLMFCEDAARKIYKTLSENDHIEDFWLKVDHKESLHPHNAVSVTVKGIENGYKV